MSEEARTVGQRENAAFGGPVSSSLIALSLARVRRARVNERACSDAKRDEEAPSTASKRGRKKVGERKAEERRREREGNQRLIGSEKRPRDVIYVDRLRAPPRRFVR
jgi:hypothetical protein